MDNQLDNVDVHDAVTRFIKDATGVLTIQAYQDEARPARPYFMVNLINLYELREHHVDMEYRESDSLNSEGQREVFAAPVIETEWEFSIHYFGNELSAMAEFRKLRSLAKIPGPNQNLGRLITLYDIDRRIVHVPEFINKRWEPRSNTKISIRGYTRDEVLIDVIDKAPFNLNKD